MEETKKRNAPPRYRVKHFFYYVAYCLLSVAVVVNVVPINGVKRFARGAYVLAFDGFVRVHYYFP